MTEQEILQTIVERLRATFDVRRVVLFGSRAKGAARPDSDFDILVEVDSDARYWQRQRLGYAAFGPRDWSMDLVVKTPQEMERSRRVRGSVVQAAETEGRVLFER
jgi:predicted nucleotidyltransferase